MNCPSTIVTAPINSLPSEILSRIFSLLHSEQIRMIEEDTDYTKTAKLPKYPDILSRVCSRWRQVAIGARTLWSYIHFVPHHATFNKRLLNRAKTCAVRSGQSPLQIHILGSRAPSKRGDEEILSQFVASNAARTGSLELDIGSNFHRSILSTYVVNGAPGVLTRLALSGSSGFIEAIGSPHRAESVLLDVSEQLLEDILFPVTVLRLNNTFPYWTSKAYHGLVELRLRGTPSITESQLVGILALSPGLRIFYFAVKITDFSPKGASIVPVQLKDLEELSLGFMGSNQVDTFLRLLAPGLKPLQLSLCVPSNPMEPTEPVFDCDIQDFFARSNVSKLYVYEGDTLLWIPEIYRLAPRLQVLVLDEFSTWREPASISDDQDSSASHSPIDHLYLLRCEIPLSRLQWMLKKYPARRLTLWESQVSREYQYAKLQPKLSEVLARDCPVVNILQYKDPYPIVDWQ